MSIWDEAEFYFKRAETNRYNREFNKAIDLYNSAIEKYRLLGQVNNLLAKALEARGICYYELEKYDDAIGDFSISLKENPDNSKGWLYIGDSYRRIGNLDKAIECLTYAVELQPNLVDAWKTRAEVFLLRIDIENAKKDLLTVLNLDPNNEWASLKLKNVSNSWETYQKEVKYFKNYINDKGIYVKTSDELKVASGFSKHKAKITLVKISGDARIAATVDSSNTILVWKIETREVLYRLVNDKEIADIRFIDNANLLICDEYYIQIIDFKNSIIKKIKGDRLFLKSFDYLDFSSNKKFAIIINIDFDSPLTVIDLSKNALHNIWLGSRLEGKEYTGISFFPGHNDNPISIFSDDKNNTYFYEYLLHDNIFKEIRKIKGITISRCPDFYFSSDKDNFISWFCVDTGYVDDWNNDVSITGTELGVKLFNLTKGCLISSWEIEGLPPYSWSIEYRSNSDGKKIIFNYRYPVLGLWMHEKNQISLLYFPFHITTLDLSYDGNCALIASEKEIYMCELLT